jgi:hypothetical protein
LAAVGTVLRCADEHFYEVVVQRVIELPLEAPFELRVVEVAGMKIEIVGVNGDRSVLELDDDFYTFAFGAGGKIQQGVFVETELSEDTVETREGGFGHRRIVKQGHGKALGDSRSSRMPLSCKDLSTALLLRFAKQ